MMLASVQSPLASLLLKAKTFVTNRISSLFTRANLRLAGALLGPRFYVHGLRPYLDNNGALLIGYRVVIRADTIKVSLRTSRTGRIVLGDRVFLNNGVEIHSETAITIGAHTRVGPLCAITDTHSHAVDEGQAIKKAPVHIGRNVWIGQATIVMPGTTIGDNSVIAAGSIVSGTVPANQLWRGAPAQFVREIVASDTFVRA